MSDERAEAWTDPLTEWWKSVDAEPCNTTLRLSFADWLEEHAEGENGVEYLMGACLQRVIAQPNNDDLKLAYAESLKRGGREAEAICIESSVALSRMPVHVQVPNRWYNGNNGPKTYLVSLENISAEHYGIEEVGELVKVRLKLKEQINKAFEGVGDWGHYVVSAVGKKYYELEPFIAGSGVGVAKTREPVSFHHTGGVVLSTHRHLIGDAWPTAVRTAHNVSLSPRSVLLGWKDGMVNELTMTWGDWVRCFRRVLRCLPIQRVNLLHPPRLVDSGIDSNGERNWTLEGQRVSIPPLTTFPVERTDPYIADGFDWPHYSVTERNNTSHVAMCKSAKTALEVMLMHGWPTVEWGTEWWDKDWSAEII